MKNVLFPRMSPTMSKQGPGPHHSVFHNVPSDCSHSFRCYLSCSSTWKDGWAAPSAVPSHRSHKELCWSMVQSGLLYPMPFPLALERQTLYCSKKPRQNNKQVTLSWLGESKLPEVVYKSPNELFAVPWKKRGCWVQECQQHILGRADHQCRRNEGCLCSPYRHTADLYNHQKSAIQTRSEMTESYLNIWKDTCIVFRQGCLTSVLTWQNRKLQPCSRGAQRTEPCTFACKLEPDQL